MYFMCGNCSTSQKEARDCTTLQGIARGHIKLQGVARQFPLLQNPTKQLILTELEYRYFETTMGAQKLK
jgi:hypothetical protein